MCPQSFPKMFFIPGRTGVKLPHDQAADQGCQQQREFLAGYAFMQGSDGELSIPTVQPWCTENVLSSNFEC